MGANRRSIPTDTTRLEDRGGDSHAASRAAAAAGTEPAEANGRPGHIDGPGDAGSRTPIVRTGPGATPWGRLEHLPDGRPAGPAES